MQDCKQEILSKIPDNNCCGHTFISVLLSTIAKVDERSNSVLISTKQDIIDKTIKIINNFYPDLEIDVWQDFLCVRGNIVPMLLDCNVTDGINLTYYPSVCDRLTIIKTLFILFGNFYYNQNNNANSKGYNLEFVFKQESLHKLASELLNQSGFSLKTIVRQNSYVLYTKNSNQICDLLVLLGAVKVSLDVQNSLAMREIRNSINRQNNCFESNLDKTLTASTEQLEAINYILEHNMLDMLDDNLKEVALARLANPDISLKELQSIISGNISRAGIKYRLDKIIAISKKLKGED